MSSPYAQFSTKVTPQSEPIPGEKQVLNSAGGYVYELDKWNRLDRFLILGSEGGTYYMGEKKLTKDNALNLLACIQEDGPRAVKRIVEVSDQGLAPKNDPAIFALALAASSPDVATRQVALSALPRVCRIPTHLFHFLEYCKGNRGWGSTLKRAVQEWYNSQPVDNLAYQLVKYQQRDGWSNRDALRKSHPIAPEGEGSSRNLLYRWVTKGTVSEGLEIVSAFEEAKTASAAQLIDLIRKHNLPREALPTEALTHPGVWEALLEKMPYTAMLRNLGNMSKIGLLKPLSSAANLVAERLVDQERIKKGRVHPIAILLALKTYAQGHGFMGSGVWTTVPKITNALDEAFYLAFKSLEPTNKRFLIALDVSGSMSSACGGLPISCAEGAAAMALSIAKVEPNYYIYGFSHVFKDLGITPKMRLDDALKKIASSGRKILFVADIFFLQIIYYFMSYVS